MKIQKPILILWCLSAVTIFAGLGVVSFFPGNLRAANATSEWRERTIRRLPIERNEPIAIGKVRVKGKNVFRNRKFLSDDDWLNRLTIHVKNRSDQAILLATIQLQFPRPSGSEGPIAIDDIYYGNRALLTRLPTMSERSSGIAPGQAVDIELSAGELDSIRMVLAETGYPSSIEKVDLRISSVIFEDDTMWEAGSHLQRDQNEPRTWTNVELSSLTKTRLGTVSSSRGSSVRDEYKLFRYPSPSSIERLFSHARSAPASPPQSGCYQFIGATNQDCGVVGHACTYRKAWVNTNFGGYYLADCSYLCSDSCGWHSSKVENACASGGGGGGGGGTEGGGCWSDWDCFAGEECVGGTCQEYGGGFGGLEP